MATIGPASWLDSHRVVAGSGLVTIGSQQSIPPREIELVVYALGTVLFLPGSVLTITGGAMFGPVWGTLWNLTGATIGATLAFMIARYLATREISPSGTRGSSPTNGSDDTAGGCG